MAKADRSFFAGIETEFFLFGNTPPFPWEQFSSLFAKCFELEDFRIEPGELRWCSHDESLSGLGDDLDPINISLSGFEEKSVG